MIISKRFKNMKGLYTIENIQKELGVKRHTAIQYMSFLRKRNLVDTVYGKGKKRVYRIKPVPEVVVGNPGYYEILNKNSPIKLWEPYEYRAFGRKISIEETIAWAVSRKENRIHLAALALFSKVKNWPRLYKWAKEYDVRRKIGALYDVARTTLKVRKIDLRIRKKLLSSKGEGKYMIPMMKSKDFREIENEWGVFISLNKADLERYKE